MTSDTKVQLGLLGLLVVSIGVAGSYIQSLKGSNAALALRAYNDSAALDQSRALALSRKDSIRILGDSLTGQTKLAVQRKQERDALDKALSQSRISLVALQVTIDKLKAAQVPSVAPVVVDTAGVRHAAFHVEHPPFTVDLGVSLPAKGAGVMDSLGVVVQPAHLSMRIGCQDPNRDGVRPARVTTTGPKWLSIFIDSAEQDKDVCQVVGAQGTSWLRRLLLPFAPELYLGIGASVDPFPILRGQAPTITPALHAGVSLFHVPLFPSARK
jgi:hypothetical protein